jgi:Putative Ig domain
VGPTGRVAVGKRVAGVIPARNNRLRISAAPLRTAAPGSCAEPNCDMSYNGGPVQHSPRVYLIFWGPTWNTNATSQNVKAYLVSLYKGLGQTSKDGWSTIVSQYGDSSGHHPVFGTSLLAGYHVDTTKPPRSVTVSNLGNEASKALSFFRIPNTNDAEVVVASQSGTCFAPPVQGGDTFAGNCGKPQTSGYCAFHNYDSGFRNPRQYLPWVNFPFQLDAGQGCGANFINSTFDGLSMTAGHETMETITDPAENAWYDLNDSLSGGEIADKCAWGGAPFGVTDPFGYITLTTGSFAMQSLWSNARGSCVMNGALKLSVTTPAAQRSILGKGVSLQIRATLGGRAPLSYAASGLPRGVSINKSTGKISGTPNGTAGTFTAKVVVSYYAGWKTVSFPWHVSSAPGAV